MKPPPPIPATYGSVTPSAAAAATAASIALPPSRRICIPACVASGSTVATAPPVPVATPCLDGCGAAGALAPATSTAATAATTRTRAPVIRARTTRSLPARTGAKQRRSRSFGGRGRLGPLPTSGFHLRLLRRRSGEPERRPLRVAADRPALARVNDLASEGAHLLERGVEVRYLEIGKRPAVARTAAALVHTDCHAFVLGLPTSALVRPPRTERCLEQGLPEPPRPRRVVGRQLDQDTGAHRMPARNLARSRHRASSSENPHSRQAKRASPPSPITSPIVTPHAGQIGGCSSSRLSNRSIPTTSLWRQALEREDRVQLDLVGSDSQWRPRLSPCSQDHPDGDQTQATVRAGRGWKAEQLEHRLRHPRPGDREGDRTLGRR